ncbi:MAG: ATP-binding protein, partial [Phycisphaerae bacterium]|nr:ATP-binding protein [Phycisphaerae bacterium]
LDLLLPYGRDGVRTVAFGDVFLDGIREYREGNLARLGMKALFPIWQQPTDQLTQSFIESGYRAIITCVDSELLDGGFVGREFDQDFLDSLPDDVDPCGENGEFHSFVYAGPIFSRPISFTKGRTVVRDDRFHFTDLLPA